MLHAVSANSSLVPHTAQHHLLAHSVLIQVVTALAGSASVLVVGGTGLDLTVGAILAEGRIAGLTHEIILLLAA